MPQVDTGVGRSTPSLSFWKNSAEALDFWADYPININESVSSFGKAYAKSQILSNLAVDRLPRVVESVSTPAVAMDLFNIAMAFGHDKLNFYAYS